jgi:hypothetical protein
MRRIKVTRILEYEGPEAWVDGTLTGKEAGVPIKGARVFANGEAVIRSGMVIWEVLKEEAKPSTPTPTPNIESMGDDTEVTVSELPAPPAPATGITVRPLKS